MALAKKGKYWYIYFRRDGKIVWQSTGCTTKEEAAGLDQLTMDDIRHHRNEEKKRRFLMPEQIHKSADAEQTYSLPPDQQIAHKRGTLALSSMWDIARKRRALSKDHRRAFDHFVENIGVKYADLVTSQMCLKYLDNYFGNSSAKTYNNRKSCLNTIFRACLVEANMTVSPFASIMNKMLTDVQSHRNLTDNEIDTIMQNTDEQVQVMVMLSRWTAQRLETCARMCLSDFDFEKKVFLMKPGKTARFNKFVCVPIFSPLEDFLKNLKIDPDIPIVANFGWKSNNAFSKKFMLILDSFNIRSNYDGKASFHSIRGTSITWMKEHGISADIRRSITGHSNLTTEDIYARSIEAVSKTAKNISVGLTWDLKQYRKTYRNS